MDFISIQTSPTAAARSAPGRSAHALALWPDAAPVVARPRATAPPAGPGFACEGGLVGPGGHAP